MEELHRNDGSGNITPDDLADGMRTSVVGKLSIVIFENGYVDFTLDAGECLAGEVIGALDLVKMRLIMEAYQQMSDNSPEVIRRAREAKARKQAAASQNFIKPSVVPGPTSIVNPRAESNTDSTVENPSGE
jgi:hypothetical protein